MTERVRPDDPRIAWQGTVSLERDGDWVMPWRIPQEDRALFDAENFLQIASMATGVRISVVSDTASIGGSIESHPMPSLLDLLIDGTLHETLNITGKDAFEFAGLPPGEKRLELWLPQERPFRIRSLRFSEGASIRPFIDTRPIWIAYGSSITHCCGARSPSQTWPAIVAREQGLNLLSLGFGGHCHLEPMVIRLIRDLPADAVSMCLGINIQGGNSLSGRTFRPAILGSIALIREKHPATPLAVMSPICSPPREETKNAVGLSLQDMRVEVERAVRTLRERGDENLHYVNGLDILGPDDAHRMPDALHPDGEGYALMGQRYLERAARRWFPRG